MYNKHSFYKKVQRSIFLFGLFILTVICDVAFGFTVTTEHPRLLLTKDKISFVRNEFISDGDMEMAGCDVWEDQDAPAVKEKAYFDGNQRLHIIGGYACGAKQYLDFEPGVEYEYTVQVYLTSGMCVGQIYQSTKVKPIFQFNNPTGEWRTYRGTFIPDEGSLMIRFYGYQAGVNSEFYIDNVSFKPTGNIVVDRDMQESNCSSWENQDIPTVKEKALFEGNQRLHISGAYGCGAKQYLNFKPGVEYEYSAQVYLISGKCKGQIYQSGKLKDIFEFNSPAGQWITYTGKFVPEEGTLMIRFYGYQSGTDSEFYIDNVTFKPTGEIIEDKDMSSSDCSSWLDQETPDIKEKIDFDGDKRLYINGGKSCGAKQYLNFKPGVEYEYSVQVYLVNGTCVGQIYQSSGNIKPIFEFNNPTGEWKTYTGTFVPDESSLMIRFYGGQNGVENKFYIDNVSFIPTGNQVGDSDMGLADTRYWENQDTPILKEKINFDGDRRLHITGAYGCGVKQYLNFKPGTEYEYSVRVYLVNGKCKAQIYQDNGVKYKNIFKFSSPTGQWITYTGKFLAGNEPLMIRFYGYEPGVNSEFYLDDVTFRPTGNSVDDSDMKMEGVDSWKDQETPTLKEKVDFDGDRRLHILGAYSCGVKQYLDFKPGVEYEYSVQVYLTSGICKGQIYQSNKLKEMFQVSAPTGQWQTFNGTFVPEEGPLMLRFYGYQSGVDSEFYIDNISFKVKPDETFKEPFFLGTLYNYVLGIENEGDPIPSPEDLADQSRIVREARSVAFVAMLGKEEKIINLAISYGEALADKIPSAGDDMAQRERLLSMAYIYDWLHEHLDSQQKENLRAAMVAHMKVLDYFLLPYYRNFTGGHSRYAHTVLLGALLALHGEYGSDATYCNDLLNDVVDNWEDGYNVFQAWVANQGGYHMGWKYGAGYTDVQPYLLWESATGESWGSTWRDDLGYFYIYGLRGDNKLPAAGDAWDLLLQEPNIEAICVVSASLNNSYAADFVSKNNLAIFGPEYLWRLLYLNDNNSTVSPSYIENLSKARKFDNTGYVIARDKWNSPDATHLVFKSSQFYSLNHHHKDQNSLVLHYKGPLLIDSGSYDSYDSSHWQNYFTRTIAHNTLVVYDQSENFYYNGNLISNDGGQKFADNSLTPVGYQPFSLDEIINNTKYQLDGISSFSQNSSQCYMKGDASKAYSSSKLDTYTRELTMVYEDQNNNGQPTINIKDHVVLNKSLTPKILFHSITEPVVDTNGQWFEIENAEGGGVRIELVAPAGAVINVVGGSGYEFFVNGTNYPPTKLEATEPGNWRVEVATNSAVTSVDFEFTLKIYDVQ